LVILKIDSIFVAETYCIYDTIQCCFNHLYRQIHMKKTLYFFIVAFLLLSVVEKAHAFSVTLKVIDKTATHKSSLASDQTHIENNIYAWVGTKTGVAVYSGDWWYPMYNGESGRPNGLLIKTTDSYTWQASFDLLPGDYKWNPGIKSWGWLPVNTSIFQYTASAGDSPDINFTVNPDGTTSGITTLTITDAPKSDLTLQVDMNHQVVSSSGVYVSGTFNNWTLGTDKMTDLTGNGIYTVTLKVAQNAVPYQYIFVNGTTWDKAEVVLGSCEFSLNRIAMVNTSSVTMPVVSFGYCSAQPVEISDKKIACIGNSITAGAGLQNAYLESWPIQLRSLLGSGYYTENMGVSGTTMMRTGDSPWWSQHQYGATIKLNPDKILISLGTNDSKTYQWNAANFKKDYLALIDSFSKIISHPTFYILTSAKAYSAIYSISDNNILNGVIPILKEISSERKIPVIDTYSATLNMSNNFPDGVHPNAAGAQIFATHVADVLKAKKPVIGIVQSVILNNYAAYQWYKNGELLVGKTDPTLVAVTNGIYQVSVKLSPNTNDLLFADEFSVDLSALQRSTVTLSVNTDLTAITDISTSNIKIAVYNDRIIIKNSDGISNIYTSNGSLVRSMTTQLLTEQAISVENYPSGVYALLINKTKSMKFIKL